MPTKVGPHEYHQCVLVEIHCGNSLADILQDAQVFQAAAAEFPFAHDLPSGRSPVSPQTTSDLLSTFIESFLGRHKN